MRKNLEIRNALTKNYMTQWELADILGVSESTLTRMMRHEMPSEKQADIIEKINQYRIGDIK